MIETFIWFSFKSTIKVIFVFVSTTNFIWLASYYLIPDGIFYENWSNIELNPTLHCRARKKQSNQGPFACDGPLLMWDRDCIYGQWLHHCMHCTVRSTKLHISRLPPNPALKSKPYPNLSVFTLLYSLYSLHSKIFGIYHPFFLQAKKSHKKSHKMSRDYAPEKIRTFCYYYYYLQSICFDENNYVKIVLCIFQ